MKEKNKFWRKHWEQPVNATVRAMKQDKHIMNTMNPLLKRLDEDEKDVFFEIVAILVLAPEESLPGFADALGESHFDFYLMFALTAKVFLTLEAQEKSNND